MSVHHDISSIFGVVKIRIERFNGAEPLLAGSIKLHFLGSDGGSLSMWVHNEEDTTIEIEEEAKSWAKS